MKLIQKTFIFICFIFLTAVIVMGVRVNADNSFKRMIKEMKTSMAKEISYSITAFISPRYSYDYTADHSGLDRGQILVKLCVKMINPIFYRLTIGQESKDIVNSHFEMNSENQKDSLSEATIYKTSLGADEFLTESFRRENKYDTKNFSEDSPENPLTEALAEKADFQNAYEAFLEENAKKRDAQNGEGVTVYTPRGLGSLMKEDYQDFKSLYSAFYVLDASTTADGSLLQINELLGADMRMKADNSKPQILVYHTHSQEGFLDSLPGDESRSVMAVGDELTKILTNTYGYNVIHLKERFDVLDRNQAYAKSEPFLAQFLAENPSIEVIIDLHRDGVAEDVHYVTDLNGKATAQFMFFNGLSRTKRDGEIDYLPNPNIKGNLAFSFQMQWAASSLYPGLTRKIYLKGYRYNMHFREKSLLIELGGQTNTFEEAFNTAEPIARLLYEVLG